MLVTNRLTEMLYNQCYHNKAIANLFDMKAINAKSIYMIAKSCKMNYVFFENDLFQFHY